MSDSLLLPYLHGVLKYEARFLNTSHLCSLRLMRAKRRRSCETRQPCAIGCRVRVGKRSFTCRSRATGLFFITPAETAPPGQLCQQDGGEYQAFLLPLPLHILQARKPLDWLNTILGWFWSTHLRHAYDNCCPPGYPKTAAARNLAQTKSNMQMLIHVGFGYFSLWPMP